MLDVGGTLAEMGYIHGSTHAAEIRAYTEERGVSVPAPPHEVETSGATVIRPGTRDFWVVWGLPSMNEYVPIEFL